MLLVLSIAAAACAAVIVYNRLRSTNPASTTQAARRAQQLAAVVLVLCQAVEGILEALESTLRPTMARTSYGRPLVDMWGEFDGG